MGGGGGYCEYHDIDFHFKGGEPVDADSNLVGVCADLVDTVVLVRSLLQVQ